MQFLYKSFTILHLFGWSQKLVIILLLLLLYYNAPCTFARTLNHLVANDPSDDTAFRRWEFSESDTSAEEPQTSSQATVVPQLMLDMYEVLTSADTNTNSHRTSNNTFYTSYFGAEQLELALGADTVRSFFSTGKTSPDVLSLHFDISAIKSQETVSLVELRVFKDAINVTEFISSLQHSEISPCLTLTLDIHELKTKGSSTFTQTSQINSLTLKLSDLSTVEYLSIHSAEFTQAILNINYSSKVKLTLRVSLQCSARITLTDIGISTEDSENAMLLVYTTVDGDHHYEDFPLYAPHDKLSKRSASIPSPETPPWQGDSDELDTSVCARHNMQVNIHSDLGWGEDRIIIPLSFNAYQCYGHCTFPIPSHLNSTNHAIIQALAHISHPLRIPPTCCVPTSLGSMSFLFNEDNNSVTLKKYKDMKVKACGCR